MLKIRDNHNLNTVFTVIEYIYKFCFLIYGFATFNSFLAQTKFISLMLALTACSGLLLLLYRLINYRSFIHNTMFWLSMLFLISYVVSFFMNMQYANINGIKTLLFMGMEFCLLLATDERKSFADIKGELKAILTFFNVYMLISSVASILLMVCGYSNITQRNGQNILSGFVWGRLWGVFVDPNYGSVLASIAILISLYAFMKYKKVWWRVFHGVNIVLQLLYVAFSDSRTGLVVLMVSLAVYFVCVIASINFCRKLLLKSIVCCVLAVLVSVAAFVSVQSIHKVYNAIVTSVSQKEPVEEKNPNEQLTVGRDQDIEEDISNRRFDLWKSALETVKLKPVFGVSFEGVADFAQKNLPDTYLVNNDHGIYNNYHNVLFNVLVGQGIVGLLIFLVMGVYAGITLIRTVCKAYGTEDYLLCAMLFSVLVLILASAMFLSEIIYAISVNMMFFWYLLGIMLKKSKEV